MPEHVGRRRAPRRPWWRTLASVRARLVMSLGLLVGFGAVGTSAFWTDTATIEIAPIQAGTLDLQLGPDPDGEPETFFLEGPGGTWTFAVVELADVLPGESVSMDLAIKNNGTAPLRFSGEAWSSNNNLSSGAGNGFLVSTTPGATAANTTLANGYRQGTCNGGTTPWWVNHRISTTPRTLTDDDVPTPLAPDQVFRVCLLVTFPTSAPDSMQNLTTTLRATFDAEQQ